MNKRMLTFLLAGLAYISSLSAQTPLPYYSGFDNASQKNGWKIFRKGDAGFSNWVYSSAGAFSGDTCLYHDYPVGGTTVTDDWFVSPGFSLTTGGVLDSVRHAFAGFGTPADGDTVAVYLLAGNADPAMATSKTLLYDFRGANYMNDNTWRLLSNVTLPASAAPCYLAIRYKTIVNWLDVKFDNIRIRGNATTGIQNPGIENDLFRIMPNPATTLLAIHSKVEISEINITDLNGRVVYKKPFSSNISLTGLKSGIYYLKGITPSGEVVTRSFIKN